MSARPLTTEQRRAVEWRDGGVFLEAGAGTGKTSVLVDRFCDAICDDGVPISAMLAITFTEKAAGELRARLRAELLRRSRLRRDDGEAEVARELEGLARESETAWISTIHGLCRRILVAHPLAAGLDPRFRVLDQAESERLVRAAFDEALEETIDGEEGVLLLAAVGHGRLRELIRFTYDELRSRGHDRPRLPDPPPCDLDGALATLATAAKAALAETADATRGKAGDYRLKIAEALEIAGGAGGSAPSEDDLVGCEFKSSAQDFSGPAVASYREALKHARRALAEIEAGPRYEALRGLLDAFAGRFEALKRERSGLDFEDLQLLARRLLRERPDIRDGYRNRFTHVMVDEFQDTNRLQLSLVRELLAPGSRLFTVGDEFQAIYGFRHADVGVFIAERDRAAGGEGEVLPLLGNFRSRPDVIGLANAVGDVLLDGFRPLTVGAVPEVPAAGEGPLVELLVTDQDGWDESTALVADERTQAYRAAEARFLAARLRELHDEGVPRGEMVLLLRARTHLATYQAALNDAGLNPHAVGGNGYWSHQQVEDLRHLLAALANPLDDIAVIGTLASPMAGVSPDALWLLRRCAGPSGSIWTAARRHFGEGWAAPDDEDEETRERRVESERWASFMPAEDVERIQRFHAVFTELRERATRLPLDVLIDRAIGELGYDLALLMRNEGAARMANVRKLMRFAREFETHEGRDLRGFVEAAEWQAAAGAEGEAATQAEGHDGVRIMTVHNAKGLEFPVVAVADLGRDVTVSRRALRLGQGDDPEGPPRVGLMLPRLGAAGASLYDHDELRDIDADREAAEEMRLVYVAATRAKDRLLLSGCTKLEKLGSDRATVKTASPMLRLLNGLGVPANGDDSLTVPAPAPREGLGATFDPVEVAVRINQPDPEEGQTARTDPASGRSPQAAPQLGQTEQAAPETGQSAQAPIHPIPEHAKWPAGSDPAHATPSAPAPTPLPTTQLTIEATAAISRRPPVNLSYSALADYRRCGYRFYAERMLGMKGADPRSAGGDGAEATVVERYAFGSAVHQLLEWSARNSWAVPGRQACREVLIHAGIPADEADPARAVAMIEGWVASDLCAELRAKATRLSPETPFVAQFGAAAIRGEIDLLAELPGGEAVIVDYKTNVLGSKTPIAAAEDYRLQRDIYALALAATGTTTIRTAYVFLDQPESPVIEAHDPAALDAARAEIEATIEAITRQDFAPTDDPHAGLCHDCPARTNLCIHGRDRTLA